MSAEYLLRDYLKKQDIKDIEVDSAGTLANPQPLNPYVLSELSSYGVDASRHKLKKVTKKMIESSDVALVMADYNREFIEEKFGIKVQLFNEFCYGKSTSVKDVSDAVLDWEHDKKASNLYTKKTIRYLHDSMPYLAKKLMLIKDA